MKKKTVLQANPWEMRSYRSALELQQKLTLEGHFGWLLFSCPPTITVGKRALPSDILVSREALARLGVTAEEVDRGGKATYHGPGQILGFPLGTLEDHTGNSRGVRRFLEKLIESLGHFVSREHASVSSSWRLSVDKAACLEGIWVSNGKSEGKLVSIGMKFSKEAIGHGFALNVNPQVGAFELIHPCGEPNARIASLFEEACSEIEFISLRNRLENFLYEQI